MDLRIFTEPQQGAGYDDLLAVALRAEALGFGAFFRSDHYLAMGVEGRPGPSDAWVTLAGLARETTSIRLGTLMTSATFRHPGPLAITVAGVDQMSGGRVELGLGAGWFEAEHDAYAIPFPDTRERFDRFEEQLAIVSGLWAADPDDGFSFEGRHYRVADSPGLPKPAQERLPVIIGGAGKRRTPALAARHADEFNVPFSGVDTSAELIARVRQACEDAGRDPATMRASNALVTCVGADEREVARRAEAIGREAGEMREADGVVVGTPQQVLDTLGRYAEAGSERVYLQILDLADLEHLDLIAAEVVPHL